MEVGSFVFRIMFTSLVTDEWTTRENKASTGHSGTAEAKKVNES